MRIQKLSPLLVNQIAAGEVIERPASVVKELLENSLDAKSRQISVEIEKGGQQLIRVCDDGTGIHKDDLPLAVKSFATSKISHIDDLARINTLGFRGEALASICAVTRFNLTSKAAGQEHAWTIKLAGHTDSLELQPAAHPQGTTITAHDLFFNTPVRRRFLRAERTEFEHIETIIKRLALSRFDVGLTLRHAQKTIFNFAAGGDDKIRQQRISRIFSPAFMRESVYFEREASGLRLWGWSGLPTFMRSQNDLQYFYINGRIIRDKLIRHAIGQAYQDLLYPGRQPAYLLYLEMDPEGLDVNVHPMKQEVRFQQPRLIYDFVINNIKKIVNRGDRQVAQVPVSAQPDLLSAQEKKQPYDTDVELRTSSKQASQASYPLGTVLAQLDNQYLLSQCERGLVLCDIHAAQIHISHHYLESCLADGGVKPRPLLVPLTLSVSEQEMQVLQHYAKSLFEFGLSADSIDEGSVAVRQIPRCLIYADIKQLFMLLCQYLQTLGGAALNQDDQYKLLIMMARSNIPQQILAREVLDQLLRELEQLKCPQKNILGQVIYKIVTAKALGGLLHG